MNRRISISLFALASALATASAPAQVVTDIVADTLPDRDLGTSVTTIGNVSTIDNGTVSGTNLFHSFQTFDLAAGDVAQWVYTPGDPAAIANVINRVTGGTPSSLFGQLDSTALPNADFFFINPAGIVFGTGAEVSVPAAAYFSTGSELRFANGDVLSVATPSGSVLSVAAPAAFGFLGGEGDISLTDIENLATTFLPGGGALTLTAANITLSNAFIGSNALALAAVGDMAAEVALDGTSGDLLEGDITLTNGSWLQTWPGGCFAACLGNAGTIRLQAGTIAIDSTGIVADFDAPTDPGGDRFVSLVATDTISIGNSFIMSNGYDAVSAGAVLIVAGTAIDLVDAQISTYTAGSGDAGQIAIAAPDIRVTGGSIGSETFGDGDAGSIVITADNAIILDGTVITSATNATGNAGGVGLTAGLFDFSNTIISSDSLAGDGDAGVIFAVGDDMRLTNGTTITSSTTGGGEGGGVAIDLSGALTIDGSTIETSSTGSGDGGAVLIAAGELSMDHGTIASNAYGSGAGGYVEVNVLGGATMWLSDIFSDSFGSGDAGLVALAADHLIMESSSITSDALADGNGGLVAIEVAGLLDLLFARISSTSGDGLALTGIGDAGAVLISAGEMRVENSEIYSQSYGEGDGGAIGIAVDGWLSVIVSYISTDTQGGAGTGGDVAITAGSLLLDLGSISSDTWGDGDGGSVAVDVAGTLFMRDFSYISADSLYGSGDGGDVAVTAANIYLQNESFISSSTFGDGDGGVVTVDSGGQLTLTGFSHISADTRDGSGTAGDVLVTAANAYLGTESYISSDAQADGDGGFLDVVITGALTLDGFSRISTNVSGAGFGGSVGVEAARIWLGNGSTIASTGTETSTGDAGDVFVTTGELVMTSGASIASDADGLGESGFVVIDAGTMALDGGAAVSTRSLNDNPAGYIDITANELRLSGVGTSIASENLNPVEGGDNAAGSVFITAGHVVIAEGARVATNSLTGVAGDITFDMPEGSLLILEGIANPGVIETSSGPGTGGIITIARPLAIISNGGTISALGDSGGANVRIDTPYFIASSDRLNTVQVDGTLTFANAIYDVSAGTVDADLAMVDASGVLRNQCSAARASGELSVLDVRPIGPFGPTAAVVGPRAVEPAADSGGCN